MTAHRDLKNIIRDRQRKTGESYTPRVSMSCKPSRIARRGGRACCAHGEPATLRGRHSQGERPVVRREF